MNATDTLKSCDEVRLKPVSELDLAGHDTAGLPEDQLVPLGEDATFTAPAVPEGATYQWVRQQRDFAEALVGETERTLTIKNTTLKDVGFYRCFVTTPDKEEATRPASLMVSSRMVVGDPGPATLTASATDISAPVVATSGSSGTCPGSYAGYASYTKSVAQGWGWAPTAGESIHTATDPNRSDTKVKYNGKSYDTGCAQTMVSVPDPCPSAKYRFTVYFPTTVPSTNAYSITLTGFNP